MKVELPDNIIARFKKNLRHAGKREIGGVLMGEQLAPGHFKIIDFSLDEITGTLAHFVRSPEKHNEVLEKFFTKTNHDFSRFNYLGEWHSHPSFPVFPSSTDIASMQDLVNGERDISFAVLLIIKLKFWYSLETSATLFTNFDSSQLTVSYR